MHQQLHSMHYIPTSTRLGRAHSSELINRCPTPTPTNLQDQGYLLTISTKSQRVADTTFIISTHHPNDTHSLSTTCSILPLCYQQELLLTMKRCIDTIVTLTTIQDQYYKRTIQRESGTRREYIPTNTQTSIADELDTTHKTRSPHG